MNMTASAWESSVYNAIDKSKWPCGPWQDEPDEVRLVSSVGLLAVIRRNAHMGSLVGYVGVPRSHPLYGREYGTGMVVRSNISVHGGITYTDNAIRGVDSIHDRWWFGFDCAHAGDYYPKPYLGIYYANDYISPYSTAIDADSYKSISFVTSQIESLALQLAMIQKSMDLDFIKSIRH